jgi:hypothetical protein
MKYPLSMKHKIPEPTRSLNFIPFSNFFTEVTEQLVLLFFPPFYNANKSLLGYKGTMTIRKQTFCRENRQRFLQISNK